MMMAMVTSGIDDDGYVNVNKIHMLTQGEATCNHMMHNLYLFQSRHINTYQYSNYYSCLYNSDLCQSRQNYECTDIITVLAMNILHVP